MAAAPYPNVDGTQPCADADPEIFFPAPSDPHDDAIDYCRRCPFIRACLAYALTVDVAGVWGATTLAQRQEIRRTNHIKAEELPTTPDPHIARIDQFERGGGASAAEIARATGLSSRTIQRYRRIDRSN